MAKVLNMKNKVKGDIWVFDTVRIDRISSWGNPFVMRGAKYDRDYVCDKHIWWLNEWVIRERERLLTL